MPGDQLKRLQQWIRKDILELEVYAPEPAGPEIRLDANESPGDLPDELKRRIVDGFLTQPWNRYPDPACRALRGALADQNQVAAEQIVVGNGSDEILRDLLTVYGGPGTHIVYPTPTFSMYRLLTLTVGARPVEVPLGPDWELPVEALLAALADERAHMLFIARPNNPTGNLFSAAQIEKILQGTDRLVVLDEAYRLFAGESFMGRLADYPHLAILHTFSKSMSMAGLRVGYLAAHPQVITALNRVRLPYNVDAFAQWSAVQALACQEYWREQAQQVIEARTDLSEALASLPAIQVFPSRANFILIRLKSAETVRRGLAAAGIAVRGFTGHPRLGDCLRITIGRAEENTRLLAALQTLI